MKYLVFESRRFEGMTAWMTFSRMSSRTVSVFTRLECWAETMTASTRTGLPPSYSTVTWLFPSGRR
jgi:hypothetical protein